MSYLFTSESVSEGHPDKVADQISDALIDNFMAFDPTSKVACETLVTTGQVVLAGEVKTKTYLDVQSIAREVISRIGYTKSEYMFEANFEICKSLALGCHEADGCGDISSFQHCILPVAEWKMLALEAAVCSSARPPNTRTPARIIQTQRQVP